MVDANTISDPRVIPVVTLTEQEKDQAEAMIAEGMLPRDWFAQYYAKVEANVFGDGFQRDKNGRPQEQGLGSPGNQTRQSVEAYRKWGTSEPDYERNLQRMEKELADSQARRRAEAKAAPPNKYGRRPA